MTDPKPRLHPGEQPLTVFISSVIRGMEAVRARAAEAARELGFDVWVFEETPASSQPLDAVKMWTELGDAGRASSDRLALAAVMSELGDLEGTGEG